MTKSQNWGFWFRTLDLLNARGREHSFSKEFRFSFRRDRIFSDCAQCGSTIDARYSQESGPFDYDQSKFATCELEAKLNAEKEAR